MANEVHSFRCPPSFNSTSSSSAHVNYGISVDYIVGVVIGFVLGYFTIIFRSEVCSTQQRTLGIVTGLVFNIFLALFLLS